MKHYAKKYEIYAHLDGVPVLIQVRAYIWNKKVQAVRSLHLYDIISETEPGKVVDGAFDSEEELQRATTPELKGLGT